MNEYAVSGDEPRQILNSKAAIEMENLSVSYGANQVLKGLSLEVPVGSIFGFLGANGAGKTTTIKTLLGFRPPNGGSARVLGYDVVRSRVEICARTGYVSEVTSLYEFLNVPQLCAFCRDMQRHWNQGVVDRYLQLFELPTKKRIKHFSKGMKSQLALCLALGNEPELLILDEPTTGLDPVARQVFLNTLVSEVAAKGSTIFFSSHILSAWQSCATERLCSVTNSTLCARRRSYCASPTRSFRRQGRSRCYIACPECAGLSKRGATCVCMLKAMSMRSSRPLRHGRMLCAT